MDHFNQLPNEVFHMIFRALPIPDLLRLPLVCKNWKTQQEAVLARMDCLTAYDLKFPWDYPDIFRLLFFKPIKFNTSKEALVLKQAADQPRLRIAFTPATFSFFKRQLNITVLSLYGIDFDFETTTNLVNCWPQLYEFNFFPRDTTGFQYEAFCQLLKEMPSLRRLGMKGFDEQETRFDFSTFASLESVLFDNHFQEIYTINDVFRSLTPAIQGIALINIAHDGHEMHQLRRYLRTDIEHGKPLANALKQNVSHLTLQVDLFDDDAFNGVDTTLLNFIGDYFTNLTHLDIHLFEDVIFREILAPLAKLPRLTNLRLDTINTCYRSRLFEIPENMQPPIMLPALPSVTRLHLSLDHSSTPSLTFYKFYLKRVFTGLKVWHFENAGLMYCCECSPDLFRDSFFNGIQCRDCPSKLLAFFNDEMPHLERVFRNRHLIFFRGDTDESAFTARLLQYGTSPYVRNSKAWYPRFG